MKFNSILYRLRIALVWTMVLTCAGNASATSDKLSPATKQFMSDYRLNAPALQSSLKGILQNDMVHAFIWFNTTVADASLTLKLGVQVRETFGDQIVTALIPATQLEALAELDCVKSISIAEELEEQTDKARHTTLAQKVQDGIQLAHPYHGKGVIVGVVDQGFNFQHPANKDLEGNQRIKYVYYKTGSSSATEYTTASQIAALTTDYSGNHGQHVLGIAAGTHYDGIGGMADSADIALAAMAGYNSNAIYLECIKKLVTYAKSQGKPIVINLSYGNSSGAHDGTTTEVAAIDALVEPGVIICIAASNNGRRNFTLEHGFYAKSDGNPYRCSFMFVPGKSSASVLAYNRGSSGETNDSHKIWVQYFVYDSVNKKEVTYKTVSYSTSTQSTSISTSYVTASISTVMGQDANNGRYYVKTTISDMNVSNSNYRLGIRYTGSTDVIGDTINVWETTTGGSVNFTNCGNSSYRQADNTHSINNLACGNKTISVGAYVTTTSYELIDGTTHHLASYLVEGDVAPMTSWGQDTKPLASRMLHPDISAPGQSVCASTNKANYSYNTKSMTGSDGNTYYWGYMSGTSMATPCAAGIIALWLEKYPTLTIDQVRDLLKSNAIKDEFTTESPVGQWGAGKINAWIPMDPLED